MWIGAFKGLAGLKFSTSPRILGVVEIRVTMNMVIKIIGRESLIENRGLNLILSGLVNVVLGLEEPPSWRRIKCEITKAAIRIGRRK